jgi:hypothetical protein
MSENNLFRGTGTSTLFRATVELPPLPPGQCLQSAEDLRTWLEQLIIQVASRENAMFGYTAGPASSAKAEDRDKPRILFDEAGRYLGLALWIPEVQHWSIAGAPGETKTVVRSAATVADDMAEKALFGWFLCDGSHAGLPDLTSKEVTDSAGGKHKANPGPFFIGTAPDWDVYTVGKVA